MVNTRGTLDRNLPLLILFSIRWYSSAVLSSLSISFMIAVPHICLHLICAHMVFLGLAERLTEWVCWYESITGRTGIKDWYGKWTGVKA